MQRPNPGSGWWVAVRLPAFRLAAALRHVPDAATAAYLIERTGRRTVLEVSESAATAGVRAGMTVREAGRVAPGALVVLDDPVRAARAWGRVLTDLRRLPWPVADDGAGLAHLRVPFGSPPERAFWAVRASFSRAGLAIRCGAAADRFTAFVASHRPGDAVCRRGGEPAFLADAPLELLGLDRDGELRARLLGVRTLGHFAALAPARLLAFGAHGVRWHGLASGRGMDPAEI
jgi:protein ImuB